MIKNFFWIFSNVFKILSNDFLILSNNNYFLWISSNFKKNFLHFLKFCQFFFIYPNFLKFCQIIFKTSSKYYKIFIIFLKKWSKIFFQIFIKFFTKFCQNVFKIWSNYKEIGRSDNLSLMPVISYWSCFSTLFYNMFVFVHNFTCTSFFYIILHKM